MDRFWTSGLVVDNDGLVPRPLLGAHCLTETLSDLMDRFWTSGLVVDNAGLVPRPLLGAHYLTETLSELMDRFWTSVHPVADNAGLRSTL